ncbi:MAG: efflux RND transporter periplasmic adaptor subunit [Paracoccaceae bacterium]
MRGRYAALSLLALGAGLAGGVWAERFLLNPPGEAGGGPEILYWVAPMDPNFRRDGPGKSPMGMDLVPVYEGEEPAGDPAEVRLTAHEINAIGVRTATARVEDVARRIETVGFVAYDEHATSHVHTRVEGWIERLAVRAVGDPVAEGDLLFELYAPEITIASSELMRARNPRDADIARRKLRNFGVSPRQIDEMADDDAPAQHIRVHAPQDGVVIALDAADGMYLEPDTRAMSLSDLASVWLVVDVFERDIGRLSNAMTVEARFAPLPGRVFEGTIDYVYPELDPTTRTLPVRLRFDNDEGLLRPNMYGSVTLTPSESREALTVPSEAVIRTGRAERVVLRTGTGTFEPRLVTTGLTGGFGAGGRTEIVQGLAPGDVVVSSAQFLIDSESALSAGMTRFAPTEAEPAPGRGEIVAVDVERRRVTIAHDAIEAIGWPAMTTAFTAQADVALERRASGEAVRFALVRGSDGLLSLATLGRDDGIEATGTGVVRAVTPDGKLDLAHDPIPALGWPAMEMAMPVAGLDPTTVPTGVPVAFDLAKGEGGTFVIVGVRGADGEAVGEPAAETPAAPPLVVDGTIEAVDPEARTARVAHGPIAEIGMPGMTMDFALADGLDPAALPVGREATLTFERPGGLTMVLAGAEAAPEGMTVDGTVNAVDAAARTASVTHGPLAAIGMPGMTMDFPLADDLDPAAIATGAATVTLMNDPERGLVLIAVEPKPAPMKVGATVNSVDAAAGTANVTHGALAAIGMPGMTMDFPLGPEVDPAALPVGEPVEVLIRQGDDLSLTLVGLAGEGAE